jgi:hypothetical protein
MYLAYLDAGSGSMLAMAVVAGFAGAMVTIKVWWRRIWNKLRRRPVETVPPATSLASLDRSDAPVGSEQDG